MGHLTSSANGQLYTIKINNDFYMRLVQLITDRTDGSPKLSAEVGLRLKMTSSPLVCKGNLKCADFHIVRTKPSVEDASRLKTWLYSGEVRADGLSRPP